jgi:hypothetical protein
MRSTLAELAGQQWNCLAIFCLAIFVPDHHATTLKQLSKVNTSKADFGNPDGN